MASVIGATPHRLARLAAVATLVGGCWVGCKSQDNVGPQSQSPKPSAPAVAASDLRPTTGPGGTVELSASSYKFEPSVIVATPGQKLTVKLNHKDGGSHSVAFKLPSGEVALPQPVPPGGTASVEITAPEKEGTYVFYCPVGSHHERGMEGKLVVTKAK